MVERDDVLRVGIAKDIPAATAVVSTVKVAKVPRTGRLITNCGLGIWLPVCSCRRRRNLPKSLNTVFRLDNLSQSELRTVARGPSTQFSRILQIVEAVAVAIEWCQRRLTCSPRRIGWSQNGGHIQGRLGWSQLSSMRRKMRRSRGVWGGRRGAFRGGCRGALLRLIVVEHVLGLGGRCGELLHRHRELGRHGGSRFLRIVESVVGGRRRVGLLV